MEGLSGSARSWAGHDGVLGGAIGEAPFASTRQCQAHRFVDVLQLLRSHTIENDILAADLSVRIMGDADASGLCDSFQPRGYIDAIAEDSVVVDDDVADVMPTRNSIRRSAGSPFYLVPRQLCPRADILLKHGDRLAGPS
jgi:hypothetical protein